QDVSVFLTDLPCTPSGGSLSDRLRIPSIPLAADGSFSGTGSQDAVIGSFPAHYTYAFSGHVHRDHARRPPPVSGILRETITTNGKTCTTGDIPFWNALRDSAQTSVQNPDPQPGSYKGTNPQNNWEVQFYVAANKKSLQDVDVPLVNVPCTPGGT